MCQPTPVYSVHALSQVSPATLLALSLLNLLFGLNGPFGSMVTQITHRDQNSVHGLQNYFLRGVTVSFHNSQISPASWCCSQVFSLRKAEKERSDAATDMGQTEFNEH